MGKLIWEGWQKSAKGAAQPIGTVIPEAGMLGELQGNAGAAKRIRARASERTHRVLVYPAPTNSTAARTASAA